MTLPGKPVYGLEHSNGGLITFPGGVPIKWLIMDNLKFITLYVFLRNGSGEFIGSIGVSGGTVEDDLVVAKAAAKAVAEL